MKKFYFFFFLIILCGITSFLSLIFYKDPPHVSDPTALKNEKNEPLPAPLVYDKSVEKGLCSRDSRDFPKGVVSLTFDDGWVEIYNNAIPLLDRAGIKSTQYISIFGPADDPEKFSTREDILAMQKAGHEIGSHAVHHKRFTEMTDAEVRTEIENSKKLLLEMGVKSIDTFAYPYGEYTDGSVKLTPENYIAARTTNPGMNDRNTDPQLLYTYELENWMTFMYLKRWTDLAVADKKWLIFTFHQVADPTYQFYTSPKDLQLLVNYLIEKKVPVMTVRDVVKKCY